MENWKIKTITNAFEFGTFEMKLNCMFYIDAK